MNRRLDWQGWLTSGRGFLWLAFGLGFAGLMVQSGLLQIWTQSEEYGHGLMVVAVLAYLVARRWGSYRPAMPGQAGVAIALALAAFIFAVLGKPSGIPLIGYYGLWLFALAAVMAVGGFGFLRKLLVPLLIVPLLFPLPNPLGPMVTSELQLISSKLGVGFIRLLGGSVYLEGNVLDMGGTKLLVAEACAGLRYLFPLMSLGAIAGLMMRAPLWMRWAVFLVTIPITIFMNSFRIAVTGMLVEGGSTAHTEGFLHLFEGWVVFIVAAVLLLGVIRVLVGLLPGRRRLFDVLSWQVEDAVPAPVRVGEYRLPAVALGSIIALMFLAVAGSGILSGRGEWVPERKSLNDFPVNIGEWQARVERLPLVVEEVAGASEYFYGDFSAPSGEVVNAYVSYYENQRHGQIPHSPKVCIPGGGWVIENQGTATIQGQRGSSFAVNRIVTGMGGRKVISYYWLKQGARVHRQEFLARLDLVRSSLLENRTDGALVRLVTELRPGEGPDAADARLKRFAAEFVGLIPGYVPD
ncbi:MAG: VPLPA-CTERM-specific exosortase XrtD [Georgfuchsia sp.]